MINPQSNLAPPRYRLNSLPPWRCVDLTFHSTTSLSWNTGLHGHIEGSHLSAGSSGWPALFAVVRVEGTSHPAISRGNENESFWIIHKLQSCRVEVSSLIKSQWMFFIPLPGTGSATLPTVLIWLNLSILSIDASWKCCQPSESRKPAHRFTDRVCDWMEMALVRESLLPTSARGRKYGNVILSKPYREESAQICSSRGTGRPAATLFSDCL